jgi:hypothetical protein
MSDENGDPRPAVLIDVIAIDPETKVIAVVGNDMMDYEVTDFLRLRVPSDVAATCQTAAPGRWQSGDVFGG